MLLPHFFTRGASFVCWEPLLGQLRYGVGVGLHYEVERENREGLVDGGSALMQAPGGRGGEGCQVSSLRYLLNISKPSPASRFSQHPSAPTCSRVLPEGIYLPTLNSLAQGLGSPLHSCSSL